MRTVRLLKNKIFITLIAVAIVLCVLPTTLYIVGGRDLLREGLSLAATPFRTAFSWCADGVTGFFDYFRSVDELLDENEKLRAELEELRGEIAAGNIAKDENAWLREQLGFVSADEVCKFTDASVVGYSSSSYSATFTIDRGSESGIERNMAVISRGGVVGHVSEVGYGYSKVTSVTDISGAVGVYCARTGIYGTAHGSEAYINDGKFCITGLPVEADVAIGDLFCSSGYGEIFPRDVAVGKVVSVERDEFLRTLTVILEPSADVASVSRVFVVTDIQYDTGGEK